MYILGLSIVLVIQKLSVSKEYIYIYIYICFICTLFKVSTKYTNFYQTRAFKL